jgi:hypothetical protein
MICSVLSKHVGAVKVFSANNFRIIYNIQLMHLLVCNTQWIFKLHGATIKLFVVLFSQMWIPLAIVLLVSTTISGISTLITNSVRTTHWAILDTSMNNKYSRPASRLYATHKVQCEHHIPDPKIGLSPEAFALNTEFDKSSKSHTRHICSGLWSITLILT